VAEIVNSIFVERPPGQVFDWVADLRNHAQMLPSTYTDFEVTTPNATGVGARLDYKIGLMGKEYPTMTEISVYQPPTRLVERADTRTEFWSEWQFQPEGTGTRVTLRTVYRPAGGVLGVLLDPLLGRRRTNEQQRRQLEKLKAAIEGTAPPASAAPDSTPAGGVGT